MISDLGLARLRDFGSEWASGPNFSPTHRTTNSLRIRRLIEMKFVRGIDTETMACSGTWYARLTPAGAEMLAQMERTTA